MAYVIEISEDKIQNLSEMTEKILKYGGKLMHCIEEMQGGQQMGERRYMGDYRHGYRNDDEWREEPQMYGDRRGGRGYRY